MKAPRRGEGFVVDGEGGEGLCASMHKKGRARAGEWGRRGGQRVRLRGMEWGSEAQGVVKAAGPTWNMAGDSRWSACDCHSWWSGMGSVCRGVGVPLGVL